MAGEKTYAEISAQILAGIRVNGNREITPPIHAAIEEAIANSMVNKVDAGLVVQALLGYTTDLTPSNDKHFTPKKYVDDLIASTLAGDFTQGGDTFGTAALLGTNDAFDLLFRTNNTSRGGIDSSGKFMAGVTSIFTDTFFSVKSHGNTSGTYAQQWKASDNTVLAWLRNDGGFNVQNGQFYANGILNMYLDYTNITFKAVVNAGNGASGNNNVFVGNGAGSSSNGNYNTVFNTESFVGGVGSYNNTFGQLSGNSSAVDYSNLFGFYAGYQASGENLQGFGLAALQDSTGSNKFAMGRFAGRLNTDSNVAIFGAYYDVYFNFDKARDALGTTLNTVRLQTAQSKEGTNESAAASIFKIAAARGTGNAAGGNIVIQFANVQASGTTRHTLSDGLTFKANTGYIWSATSTGENILLSGAYQSKSANYTALPTDQTIECTSGTFTVTLHTAVGYKGRDITINNQGAGVITVDGDGSETINGATTQTLNQYDSLTIRSNGTNWIII